MKQEVASHEYETERGARPRRRHLAVVGLAVAALVGGGVIAGSALAGVPLLGKLAPEPLVQQGAGSKMATGGERLLPASWQQPQSGWLYVLDSNQLSLESQVLLVDPAQGTVKGVIRAGYDPAIALSPDGRRLYLASKSGGSDRLSVIDTATAALVGSATVSFRWTDTLLPTTSSLAVSQDGTHVYVRTLETLPSGLDRETVATLDARSIRFTGETVDLTGCGASAFLAVPRASARVFCLGSNSLAPLAGGTGETLRIPRVTDERRDVNGNRLNLGRLAGGTISVDGKTIYAVSEDGRLTVEDATTQVTKGSVDLGIGTDRWVLGNRVTASADGKTLYLAVGRLADRDHSRADRVLVVDTASLAVVRTITVDSPIWSLALSRDGRQLYAAQPESQSLAVIDLATGRQRAIATIGQTPALITAAP